MKYFAEYLCQEHKTGYSVCGDTCSCERSFKNTTVIVCDGIGSGVYANIAAITCTGRIKELLKLGVSLRNASEMVASSMHRARKEKIPFAAFSVAVIQPDGHFTVFVYEAPAPVIIKKAEAEALEPVYHTCDQEVVGEYTGKLLEDDSLILCSDGVTEAGLGRGHGLGIGVDGVVDFINENHQSDKDIRELPSKIVEYCGTFADGIWEDDTTLALINCRKAEELTLLTGPPSKSSIDREYAETIKKAKGRKIICGATTAEIVSRELEIPVETKEFNSLYGTPPEYKMEGVDLATEGAITLNQVCNVLDDPIEKVPGYSTVKFLCILLKDADVIHFHIGNANNDAHEDLLFKQAGVRVRQATIETLTEKLMAMGKVVTKRYY